MNKDSAQGALKNAAGSVESAFGKATGNTDTQVKGEIKKAEGKIQQSYGEAKDNLNKPA